MRDLRSLQNLRLQLAGEAATITRVHARQAAERVELLAELLTSQGRTRDAERWRSCASLLRALEAEARSGELASMNTTVRCLRRRR